MSHFHINNIMLSKIFLNFVCLSKLRLSKEILWKCNHIILNTPGNTIGNTSNYVCDLDPLSKRCYCDQSNRSKTDESTHTSSPIELSIIYAKTLTFKVL